MVHDSCSVAGQGQRATARARVGSKTRWARGSHLRLPRAFVELPRHRAVDRHDVPGRQGRLHRPAAPEGQRVGAATSHRARRPGREHVAQAGAAVAVDHQIRRHNCGFIPHAPVRPRAREDGPGPAHVHPPPGAFQSQRPAPHGEMRAASVFRAELGQRRGTILLRRPFMWREEKRRDGEEVVRMGAGQTHVQQPVSQRTDT